EATRLYEEIRDFFKASERVWGDAWGHASYMVTRPVTLKALVRVCADLSREDEGALEGRIRRWGNRLSPWREIKRRFRAEGSYTRCPAKGQVERVGRIHRELAKAAGLRSSREN